MDTRRRYALAALAIFALHAGTLVWLRTPLLASNLALCFAVALSAMACYRQGRPFHGVMRFKWILFSIGLLLWFLGQLAFTYYEVLKHSHQETALNSDFIFFLFGIPLLLALSSSNERKGSTTLLVIDGLQAMLAVYLIHLQLFPGNAGTGTEGAISQARLNYAYDFENVALSLAATARIFARPKGAERRLYFILCGFLWFYSLTATVLNHTNVSSISMWTLGWDLPFLLLVPILSWNDGPPEKEASSAENESALLIISACPIFFTMALLIMSIYVAQTRFALGVSCIVFALLTYGLRNSLLQRRFMQAERQLLDSETALRRANERFEDLSYIDALTGIANRRKFEEVLNGEWNRALRTGSSLSLLMIDLDQFKLLNDRHGHLHGDDCLVVVAHALAGNLRRSGELVARYGGEEFVAVLPNVDAETARQMAEEMRAAILLLALSNENGSECQFMTISVGVATVVPEIGHSPETLVRTADQALYAAKAAGRNRVRHADSPAHVAHLAPSVHA